MESIVSVGLGAWVSNDSRMAKYISTFRFRVKFVLGYNVSISFDPSGVSGSTVTLCCGAELPFGVLVDPFLIKPLPRVGIVWSHEMKFLRVYTLRVPKWDYVSG